MNPRNHTFSESSQFDELSKGSQPAKPEKPNLSIKVTHVKSKVNPLLVNIIISVR